MSRAPHILLGVTGGIAAYKACELVRLLVKDGVEVHVVMTEAATRFVTPLTFETLSLNPVGTTLWAKRDAARIEHTELGREVDLIAIAPATAQTIGRIAGGLADDLLSTTVMASRRPVLLFPSMNEAMFANPLVQANLSRLAALDRYTIVQPDEGELACQVVGKGRLPEPEAMRAHIWRALTPARLAGKRVVVTAGATRAPIDAVRFISNPSTGRMGFALADAAWRLGADVTLVTGPTLLSTPTGVRRIEVTTPEQMGALLADLVPSADWLLMSAAVGDFRLAAPFSGKLKKDSLAWGLDLHLERGPDLLLELAPRRGACRVLGFAAETADHEAHARAKLARKGLDFLFVNPVEGPDAGFAAPRNRGVLLSAKGARVELPDQPKAALARALLDALLDQMQADGGPGEPA